MTFVPSSAPQVETFVDCASNDCDCNQLRAQLADRERQIDHMADDLALWEGKFRQAARAEQAVRRELQQVTEQDPKAQEIRGLLDYWLQRLGKTKQTKTPLDGDRAKAVRRALKWKFEPATIRRAIDGCARFPCVGPKGRCPAGTPGASRHDDITLILRDEATIERFVAYADAPPPAVVERTPQQGIGVMRLLEIVRLIAPGVPDRDLQERLAKALDDTQPQSEPAPPKAVRTPEQVQATRRFREHHFQPDDHHPAQPFEAFVAEVERHGKRVVRNYNASVARAACPGHDGDGLNLKVALADDGRVLLHCHSHGCSTEDICGALDWPVRWLFQPGVGRV